MKEFLLNSLALEYPDLCLDWHPSKNLPLTTKNVSFGSGKKVWWKCHICSHEWKAYISNRRKQYKNPNQKGTACPNCVGKIFNKNNSFATRNPDLVKEWHPIKNSVSPNNIISSDKNKYWWVCFVCKNEWQATANSRDHGAGCPLCAEFKNRTLTTAKKWKSLNRNLILKPDI